MNEAIEVRINCLETSVTKYSISYEVRRKGEGCVPYASFHLGVLEGPRTGDKYEHLGVSEFFHVLESGYAVTLVLRSILT